MKEVIQILDSIDWPASVTRPDIENEYDVYLVDDSVIEELNNRYSISIFGSQNNNHVAIHRKYSRQPGEHHLVFNGSNSIAVLDEKSAFRGKVIFEDNCLCVLMGHQHALNVHAHLYGQGTLIWGRGARTYDCRIWVHGGRTVSVGDDCLFSEAITIRTSDHHSVVDLDTYEVTNHPENVALDRHVWIGPSVSITRGVTIGKGSIVGLGSVVTSSIPDAELWAGVPAKCIRKNVSWVDSHPADKSHIEDLKSLMGASKKPDVAS